MGKGILDIGTQRERTKKDEQWLGENFVVSQAKVKVLMLESC